MKHLAPAIFLGHGSPMNILENNLFTRNIQKISPHLKNYKGIVCLSAHYLTSGLYILENEFPKTIHDYYGFPKELYELNYPVKNPLFIIDEIESIIALSELKRSNDWGLDHGAWHPLWHLLRPSQIPVVMLSINKLWSNNDFYLFGKKLLKLRKSGFIILGSGNVVHSFKGIDFLNQSPPHAKALEFEKYVRSHLISGEYEELVEINEEARSAAIFAINTFEHYWPFLATLGSLEINEEILVFNDKITHSTISMLSFLTKLESPIYFE